MGANCQAETKNWHLMGKLDRYGRLAKVYSVYTDWMAT